MGEGLKGILKLYGAMNVSAEGNKVRWVWDYANNKSRLLKDMTKEEIAASEKAKWEQHKTTDK